MSVSYFLKRIGENIAHYRKLQFLNQIDTAQKVGISYRYYQRIESGEANITIATLYRLAEYFNIHPMELLPKDHKP